MSQFPWSPPINQAKLLYRNPSNWLVGIFWNESFTRQCLGPWPISEAIRTYELFIGWLLDNGHLFWYNTWILSLVSSVWANSSFSFLCPRLLSKTFSDRCPVCEVLSTCWFCWHWNVMVVLILEASHSQDLPPPALPSQVELTIWEEKYEVMYRQRTQRMPSFSSQDLYGNVACQERTTALQH